MTTREKNELFPTLKVNPDEDDDNAVAFTKKMQIEIVSLKDVDTKFGKKLSAVVNHDGKKYSVFINSTSKNNLIDGFGTNDNMWIGKICNLELEKDKTYNKQMIVFHPIK